MSRLRDPNPGMDIGRIVCLGLFAGPNPAGLNGDFDHREGERLCGLLGKKYAPKAKLWQEFRVIPLENAG